MFGLGSKRNTDVEGVAPPPALTTFCASALSREPGALEALHAAVGESQRCDVLSDDQLAQAPLRASYVLSLFIEPSRLDALADAFVAGEAPVSPLKGASTCRVCRREALCRIFDSDPLVSAGEDDAQ